MEKYLDAFLKTLGAITAVFLALVGIIVLFVWGAFQHSAYVEAKTKERTTELAPAKCKEFVAEWNRSRQKMNCRLVSSRMDDYEWRFYYYFEIVPPSENGERFELKFYYDPYKYPLTAQEPKFSLIESRK